jgi:pimeloyl-ACP methyl ester carboxylesterase
MRERQMKSKDLIHHLAPHINKANWSNKNVLVDGEIISIYEGNLKTEKDKPTILFFHGWGEGPISYIHLLNNLLEEGYRVVAPNFPGSGDSTPLLNPSRSPILRGAERVTKALEQYPLGDNLWIVSHSMGSSVATEYMVNNIEKVKGLIMFCPIGEPTFNVKDWLITMKTLFFDFTKSDKERRTYMAKMLTQSPTYRIVTAIASKLYDLTGTLDWISRQGASIYLITASQDKIVETEKLKKINGLNLHEVNGSHQWPVYAYQNCSAYIDKIITNHQS